MVYNRRRKYRGGLIPTTAAGAGFASPMSHRPLSVAPGQWWAPRNGQLPPRPPDSLANILRFRLLCSTPLKGRETVLPVTAFTHNQLTWSPRHWGNDVSRRRKMTGRARLNHISSRFNSTGYVRKHNSHISTRSFPVQRKTRKHSTARLICLLIESY